MSLKFTQSQLLMFDAARDMAKSNPEALIKNLALGLRRLQGPDLQQNFLAPGHELTVFLKPDGGQTHLQIFEILLTGKTANRKFAATVTSRIIDFQNQPLAPDFLLTDASVMHLPDGSLAVNTGQNVIHLPNNESSIYYLKTGSLPGDPEITSMETAARILKNLPK